MSLYGAVDKKYLHRHKVTTAEAGTNIASFPVFAENHVKTAILIVTLVPLDNVVAPLLTVNVADYTLTCSATDLDVGDYIYAICIPIEEHSV